MIFTNKRRLEKKINKIYKDFFDFCDIPITDSPKEFGTLSLKGRIWRLGSENRKLRRDVIELGRRLSDLERYLGVEYKTRPDNLMEYPKHVRKQP